MKKEASVPKVVDFAKDYKSLKNCFEIVVTENENENSSDEEDFNSEDNKIESCLTMKTIFCRHHRR